MTSPEATGKIADLALKSFRLNPVIVQLVILNSLSYAYFVIF
jgi:hypothetical protein